MRFFCPFPSVFIPSRTLGQGWAKGGGGHPLQFPIPVELNWLPPSGSSGVQWRPSCADLMLPGRPPLTAERFN